ncbi:MAG: deoxyribodipyrimidine photo-lyase [Chromatiales bacterium]|nr:deoxyribodipyrimidine photo-lyase [Chromatiales bacterium]
MLWFRRDLRLTDNPALLRATEAGRVLPLYIHAPEEETPWAPGAASRWWLHHSLTALREALRARGSDLVIRSGAGIEVLRELLRNTGATQVFWNRLYEPVCIARDSAIKHELRDDGIVCESFDAALLHEPWTVKNKAGAPFRVFTPFWKHCRQLGDAPLPQPAPRRLPPLPKGIVSSSLDALGLLPRIGWDAGLAAAWQPGEAGALHRLREFVHRALADYAIDRDRPDLEGSSRLSPHLHFGEIGPRQLVAALHAAATEHGVDPFLRQLGWREFAHHLLYHFPHTADRPLDARFESFPWTCNEEALAAWQHGRTGIPIVDAGMRELWQTGWMHNRVRMLAASLLTKNLRIDWHAGAKWFWDTLVDADLANDTLGWQWTAGCGADAAPYFRVFNPVLQGARFDPRGDYVRRWLPELARLPTEHLHAPWQAPARVLSESGVRLGIDYPLPIVDLADSREAALAAWQTIR